MIGCTFKQSAYKLNTLVTNSHLCNMRQHLCHSDMYLLGGLKELLLLRQELVQASLKFFIHNQDEMCQSFCNFHLVSLLFLVYYYPLAVNTFQLAKNSFGSKIIIKCTWKKVLIN